MSRSGHKKRTVERGGRVGGRERMDGCGTLAFEVSRVPHSPVLITIPIRCWGDNSELPGDRPYGGRWPIHL